MHGAKMGRQPVHILVIGDGNRRWAKVRGLPEHEGHLASVPSLMTLIESWQTRDIQYLTFWWSSADNIRQRDPTELKTLFKAYHHFFDAFDGRPFGTELRAYGRWRELLPSETVARVMGAIERSAREGPHVLSFLLAYNGDEEMFEMIERIRHYSDRAAPVSEDLVRRHLPTGDLPSVDLVIRTGGDPHLSTGFMMWQTRYAQLWFTDTLWPDFTPAELDRALDAYASARRRFGK